MNNNTSNNNGVAVATMREIGEAKVGLEAFSRAGRNPNLKGVVQEVIYKDVQNISPKNIISGNVAKLSKSTTAVRDDVIIQNSAKKVISRIQCKDTPASISKTINQVKSGHYTGTNLMGTKETVTAYNEAVKTAAKNGTKITQKMTSTGISSSDTSRIASKTIGNAAGKLTTQSVAKCAAASGGVGAAISGGIELISSGIKLANYEITSEEFAKNVAKETVGGGLSAAGGSAVATIAATGAATALAATAAPVWVPVAIGIGAAVAVGSVIKSAWDFIWD